MLDVDSPTFAVDFATAIGLQPGKKMEIMTLQFERTDGVQVPVLVDFNDWENLHKKDETTLRALGFEHWLFPKEWYDIKQAPKDGRFVFIRDNFGHVDIAKWSNEEWAAEFGVCSEPAYFSYITIMDV